MVRPVRPLILPILTALPLMLLMVGCSSTAGTSPTAGGSSTSGGGFTPTPLSSPTATSAPTTCAQLSGFGGATPFSVIAAPANTIGSSGGTSGGTSGQWAVQAYSLCSPNSTTVLEVNSGGHGSGTLPLLSYLPFVNWGPNNYFPAEGIAPTSCGGGGHCFLKYDNTQFLDIDQVTDNGHGLITWRLRIANPPTAPACSSSFSSGVQDPTGGAASAGQEPPIPLPPLTHAGPAQGAAGNFYLSLCSAGSGTSVQAFLAEAMPAFGWQSNGTNAWKQTVGSNIWYVEFGGTATGTLITNAQNWLEDTHPPQPA